MFVNAIHACKVLEVAKGCVKIFLLHRLILDANHQRAIGAKAKRYHPCTQLLKLTLVCGYEMLIPFPKYGNRLMTLYLDSFHKQACVHCDFSWDCRGSHSHPFNGTATPINTCSSTQPQLLRLRPKVADEGKRHFFILVPTIIKIIIACLNIIPKKSRREKLSPW